MKMISFAWTSPALVMGAKTCTRRNWKARHAARYHAGELVAGYDRQPLYQGHQLAVIRLTVDPLFTGELPDADWRHEGFEWLSQRGFTVNGLTPQNLWDLWRTEMPEAWVIRFELVELTREGQLLKDRIQDATLQGPFPPNV